MRQIFSSVFTSLILLVALTIFIVPTVSAGGEEEHFEFQQTGVGAPLQTSPAQQPTEPGIDAGLDTGIQDVTGDVAEEPAWTPDRDRSSDRSRPRWWPSRPSKEDEEAFQRRFSWWPTDAKPAPVKDNARGGYWWWPDIPGEQRPWGNRGHVYVRKIIFDYKEVPTTSPEQLKPSLIVKKILKNVKIYFDFDKAEIRDDAHKILKSAVRTLGKNPDADILITGHADVRGSENYNLKLGERRADAIKQYMLANEVAPSRIRILSRGKLDAIAPVTDIVGMQRDRNAQFMVAEVVEIMIPESQRHLYEDVSQPGEVLDGSRAPEQAEQAGGASVVEPEVQEIESEIRVGFTEYTIREGDTLGALAKEVYGSAMKWEYIFNFNRDVIKNPHKLKVGTVIRIPEE